MLTKGLKEFKVCESVLGCGVVAWAGFGLDVVALGGEVTIAGDGIVRGCLCGLVVWTDAGHGHPAWLKVAVSVAHYWLLESSMERKGGGGTEGEEEGHNYIK
ncbi:hypothetical protein BKA57DRAFT_443897 [Linnemannia elongata]|nr:hypothetical protein BKA57DRAFT_443897 [Linnemannia elongata]